jgi:hypothetical protein
MKTFLTTNNFLMIMVCIESLIRIGFNIFPIILIPLMFINIILINYENELSKISRFNK